MIYSSICLEEYTQDIVKGKLSFSYYLFQFWNRPMFRMFMHHWLPVNNNCNWSETDICDCFDHERPFGPEGLACNLSKVNFAGQKLMLERSTLDVSIDWRKPPAVYLMKRLFSGSLFSILLTCYYDFTWMASAAACCRVVFFKFHS